MEFYVAIGLFVLTLVFFLVAWYEDIDKDFFKVGPPVRLGTINIDTTLKFLVVGCVFDIVSDDESVFARIV